MSSRKPATGNTTSRKQGLPRLSVIVCTYNRKNMVLTALAHLRRQTLAYDQFEVIVVDNGSSDGTPGAVKAYVSAGSLEQRRPEDRWRVRVQHEPRHGLIYARNTGLSVASGEIAVFLDDDTLVDPTYLEQLLKTFDETGADAVGGRVELRWEAARPYWLTDDLLDILGYFSPASIRTPLPTAMAFSSCAFSVKVAALRAIGLCSPLLHRHSTASANTGIVDMCQRLRASGYTLWYEPNARVAHRVLQARLTRPFFVGRAYWEGRSEVLIHNTHFSRPQEVPQKHLSDPATLHELSTELLDMAQSAFVDRPLLFLAGKPSNERLHAAMAQARLWGHIRQQIQCIEHAPAQTDIPSVLLVHAGVSQDISFPLFHQAVEKQGIQATSSITEIPLSWLWQHRAYQSEAIGILHFYSPGAFNLTPGEQQRLWFLIRLARSLRIRIVTSDTGGWWQSTQDVHNLPRHTFEQNLMHHSDAIFTHTRQPDQLYPDKHLHQHARCFPPAGYLGHYATLLPRAEARYRLGLPASAGYTYLCFASYHSERELLFLLDAFEEARQAANATKQVFPGFQNIYLLIVGNIHDKQHLLLKRMAQYALHPSIHFYREQVTGENIPLHLGAANAVVLPHFALHNAGTLEPVMLALSYERPVIIPDLPRFRGMFFPRATSLYTAGSHSSLIQALHQVQTKAFQLHIKDRKTFAVHESWQEYARRVTDVYKHLLMGEN